MTRMSAAGDLPAFPYSTPPTHRAGLGLTKRELFAAMAMQGTSANAMERFTAEECVAMADALIAALNK